MTEELKSLLNNSYSVYSHYSVASIVVMKDGKTFKGVNVENASYGACICAERSAVVSAISNGYTKGDFDSIYIMNSTDKIGPSCFLCRQVISELFDKTAKVIFMNILGEMEEHTVEEICPYPFDSDKL